MLFAQILNAYNTVSNTGTVAWDLPQWGASDARFKTYSGTTCSMPETGEGFMGYFLDVRLIIYRITP